MPGNFGMSIFAGGGYPDTVFLAGMRASGR